MILQTDKMTCITIHTCVCQTDSFLELFQENMRYYVHSNVKAAFVLLICVCAKCRLHIFRKTKNARNVLEKKIIRRA